MTQYLENENTNCVILIKKLIIEEKRQKNDMAINKRDDMNMMNETSCLIILGTHRRFSRSHLNIKVSLSNVCAESSSIPLKSIIKTRTECCFDAEESIVRSLSVSDDKESSVHFCRIVRRLD